MAQKIYICWSNGSHTDACDSVEEAEEKLSMQYPEVTFGPWEDDSWNGLRSRCLVWESEEEADDDDGRNAIAEIVCEEDEPALRADE